MKIRKLILFEITPFKKWNVDCSKQGNFIYVLKDDRHRVPNHRLLTKVLIQSMACHTQLLVLNDEPSDHLSGSAYLTLHGIEYLNNHTNVIG